MIGLLFAQVAHAMTAQAAIETRARNMWVHELAHYGEQIIQRQERGVRSATASCAGLNVV